MLENVFLSSPTKRKNKLECLPVGSFSSHVMYLAATKSKARQECVIGKPLKPSCYLSVRKKKIFGIPFYPSFIFVSDKEKYLVILTVIVMLYFLICH
jgi:hypothetical protein